MSVMVRSFLFIFLNGDSTFFSCLVSGNVVEHLQSLLVPLITFVIAALNSRSLTGIRFPLFLQVNITFIRAIILEVFPVGKILKALSLLH